MTIIGRLADTPTIEATSTGQEILKYAVGTSSGPRDNQKTSWFRVVSFLPEGPQRDFISSLDKGYVTYIYAFTSTFYIKAISTWRCAVFWDINNNTHNAKFAPVA